MEPDVDSDEETKTVGSAAAEEVDEETRTKNFMVRLYEDESFLREKTLLEE